MKISNFVLSLAFAGLCLNQASAQDIGHPKTAASRSIGDSSAAMRPTQFNAARNLSDDSVGYAVAENENSLLTGGSTGNDQGYYSDVSYAGGQTQSFEPSTSYSVGPTGYGSGSCRNPQVWFSSETLLWFTKSVASPALVNTSGFGVPPVNGGAGVQTVFGGGDGIDYGLTPGFRISGGMYLGPDQKVGIGGRLYGLFDTSETYSLSSDGSGSAGNPSIGVPFYNLFQNREDAYLVAYQDGIDPNIDGSIQARSDLDMYGADSSLYLLLTRSDTMRMDLLGGYTYNLLKNSVGIETTSTRGFPLGGTTRTNDLFATENTFNGGHLGVLSSVNHSRVSFSTLAKIAFGSMQQSGSIRGYSDINGSVVGAGILTQPSNIGEYSRDTFAFLPELGLKLGFAARENVQFTVGYTMMMWSGVALAGNQIDSAIDPTQLVLPNAGTRPDALFASDTFWMQGIDLGMNFTF